MLNLLHRSVRLVRQRAFVNMALGGAFVLSMIAVCCGVGVITAPWFMAELLAVQLAEVHGRRLPRTRGWIAATGVLLAAVLLVAASAWLTTLAFQTQVHAELSAGTGLPVVPELSGLLIAALTTVIALAAVIPLFYAPVILLDRGGNVGGAVLESVRLVVEGGFLRHLMISSVSHLVQASPLLLAMIGTAAFAGWFAVPTGLVLAIPLLCVSLPVGQAMFVTAYSDVAQTITDPRRTRFVARPPLALIATMVLCVLTPIASLFAFGGSLVRPSHVREGAATTGVVIGVIDVRATPNRSVFPPDTTLEIRATKTRVRVTAGDGGGAGTLPLRGKQPLQRVRVLRSGDTFAIEMTRDGKHFTTRVDGAGVRLDDGLRARLSDRAPLWAITFMLGTLLLTLAMLGSPVYQLALVRRLYTLSSEQRPSAEVLHHKRARAIRHAWMACAAMTPALSATTYWATRAVLRL